MRAPLPTPLSQQPEASSYSKRGEGVGLGERQRGRESNQGFRQRRELVDSLLAERMLATDPAHTKPLTSSLTP